jgi:hypothetical protein
MLDLYNPTIDCLVKEIDNHAVGTTHVRGLSTKEVQGARLVWSLLTTPHRQGMATRLGLLEGWFMIAGEFHLASVAQVAPKADLTLFGPMAQYGPRLLHQWPRVVHALRLDSSSRRAVMVLPRWTETGTSNCPCTVSVQFLVRNGFLDAYVYYRSWDVGWGLPYDTLSISLLAQVTARLLDVLPGHLVAFVCSLHYYLDKRDILAGSDYLTIEFADSLAGCKSIKDWRLLASKLVANPAEITDYTWTLRTPAKHAEEWIHATID